MTAHRPTSRYLASGFVDSLIVIIAVGRLERSDIVAVCDRKAAAGVEQTGLETGEQTAAWF